MALTPLCARQREPITPLTSVQCWGAPPNLALRGQCGESPWRSKPCHTPGFISLVLTSPLSLLQMEQPSPAGGVEGVAIRPGCRLVASRARAAEVEGVFAVIARSDEVGAFVLHAPGCALQAGFAFVGPGAGGAFPAPGPGAAACRRELLFCKVAARKQTAGGEGYWAPPGIAAFSCRGRLRVPVALVQILQEEPGRVLFPARAWQC